MNGHGPRPEVPRVRRVAFSAPAKGSQYVGAVNRVELSVGGPAVRGAPRDARVRLHAGLVELGVRGQELGKLGLGRILGPKRRDHVAPVGRFQAARVLVVVKLVVNVVPDDEPPGAHKRHAPHGWAVEVPVHRRRERVRFVVDVRRPLDVTRVHVAVEVVELVDPSVLLDALVRQIEVNVARYFVVFVKVQHVPALDDLVEPVAHGEPLRPYAFALLDGRKPKLFGERDAPVRRLLVKRIVPLVGRYLAFGVVPHPQMPADRHRVVLKVALVRGEHLGQQVGPAHAPHNRVKPGKRGIADPDVLERTRDTGKKALVERFEQLFPNVGVPDFVHRGVNCLLQRQGLGAPRRDRYEPTDRGVVVVDDLGEGFVVGGHCFG